jgi:hypothetical protein
MLLCVFLSKVTLDKKNSGHHDFQIDLALSLMNYGIGLQWDCELVERPNFNRQDPFVSCDCGKYFFLLEWNHQQNCASTREESKSYCVIQMWGTCDDE